MSDGVIYLLLGIVAVCVLGAWLLRAERRDRDPNRS